jgi:hypothetical protein
MLLAVVAVLALTGMALPASAAPPICGTPIVSDVTLTADLECSGSDGLVVGADGITVDLNGFTVSGDGTIGTVGVRARGVTGVTILSGTVRGFHIGVVVETDDRGTTTSGDDRPGSATVSGVTARSNLVFGFLVTPSAPGALGSSAAFVGNAAIDNGDPGFWFDRGSFVAESNLSRNNGGVGFGVHGANGTLRDALARNNGLQGILVVDSVDTPDDGVATLTDVLSRNNGRSGITVGGGGIATLTNVRSYRNGEFGFECGWSVPGTVIDSGKNKAMSNLWGEQDSCGIDT